MNKIDRIIDDWIERTDFIDGIFEYGSLKSEIKREIAETIDKWNKGIKDDFKTGKNKGEYEKGWKDGALFFSEEIEKELIGEDEA